MIYRHNKTGNLYRILYFVTDATNARNGRWLYLYARADGPLGQRIAWRLIAWLLRGLPEVYVRELAEFDAKFTLATETKAADGAAGGRG